LGLNDEIALYYEPTDNYVIRDIYGNSIYVTNFKNKDDMFDLLDTKQFQFIEDMEEVDKLISKHYKRKRTYQ